MAVRPEIGPEFERPRPAAGGHPRVRLTVAPTPLVEAPRLAAALGLRALHIKRDDLTGFAVAGNKGRKLEFLLGDAVARGCDVLVTGGGPGSNFCAAAAAAARVAGLRCELVLYGDAPAGGGPVNLALSRAWGAHVRFTGDPDRTSVDRGLESVSAAVEAAGGRPYVVPRGGATAVGALGYAEAAEELAAQLEAHRLQGATVVVATGSGGTQAGLIAGASAAGLGLRVVGASVSRPPDEIQARIASIADGCAALVGGPAPDASLVRVVDARGPGYGVASEEGARAARLAADTEGILLDHVFTAKALAVAATLGERDLVFLHTGGVATSLAALAAEGARGAA